MSRYWIAAALALLTAGLLAVPASANIRDFRVGLNDSFEMTAGDLAGMGAANAGVFRTNFSWVRIESGTPQPRARCNTAENRFPGVQYNWGPYDQMVRRATTHGIRLLPVIVGSPNYVARESTHSPLTGNRLERETYKCFVQALAARYGRGGDFTSQPGTRAITQWQAWNEPNLIKFSTEELGVSPREYARLVALTSDQIRAEDPRATVALAGLPVITSRFTPARYLRQFYRARGIERKFDVVALHPYARNHRGVEGAVLRVRRMLADVGDSGRYIWITETGWATHGGGFPFLVKGMRGQATQLQRTFEMLRRNRRAWNIGTVAWFRWRDKAVPAQNRGAFDYTGIYTQGGQAKPSCRKFVSFTNGRCVPLP